VENAPSSLNLIARRSAGVQRLPQNLRSFARDAPRLSLKSCPNSSAYLGLALFMQSLMNDLRSFPARFFLSARFLQVFILSF
jgi:hypothetical protein